MYQEISKWIGKALSQEIPEKVVAFCFNLYEDGDDQWSMELIGAERFDLADEDWACDEVTDLGTREERFVWEKPAEWNVIPDETVAFLKEYLERGEFAEVLKSKAGVAVGFVDGDIVVLYQN